VVISTRKRKRNYDLLAFPDEEWWRWCKIYEHRYLQYDGR
jgi:hypothetical protein